MDASPLRIAVTGHRPEDLFGYDECEGWRWLRAVLRRVVGDLSGGGACELMSGMAIGVDQEFAAVGLDAGLPVEAFVPFPGQESRWPPEAQAHYRRLLRRCRVQVVSPCWSKEAFQRRNEAVVDACDVLVAVWTGKPSGGTFRCLRYALDVGCRIVWVDPVRRRVADVGDR